MSEAAAPEFVHLSLHTEYSLADSLIRIKPLMQAVAAAEMPAVALTDLSNLFAMVKFYRAAIAAGIKPIIGADLRIRAETADAPPGRLILLCQNYEGYRNLTRLVSLAYLKGQHGGMAQVESQWLREHSSDLIVLSGGREGAIGRALLAGNREQALQLTADFMALYDNRFYLEIQRTDRDGEASYNEAVLDLAAVMDCPVVATNDVRFLHESDFHAHEARVCIHESRVLDDPRRQRRYSSQQYLRSGAQMAELFSDLPEALRNSVEIARRCNLKLEFGTYYLPDFPVPADLSMDDFFRQQAREGLDQRLRRLLDPAAADLAAQTRTYHERLEIELDVIVQMGFPGYFLIVADFIQWAKNNGVPVGPGRGSGAGSLVAYALGITDLDPLKYDLLFERFLNPERVSMPDFDVDFCMEGRDRVIDYVAEKYGRDKVSQIITYGSMAAKAVVRDVGRVMGHPFGFVDRIAKLIPFEVGMTLEKALETSEDLRRLIREDDEVESLMELARALEGLARNAGKHAGGVVIAPTGLTDFTPLYCEESGGGLVTQFDKDDVESIGLVKFDFLGLRTLTIIDWAVRIINKGRAIAGEPALDINALEMEDRPTYELLKRCQTTAVFQLESRGMKDLIRRLKPDCFEDIVALVALFRPGPLQSGMVDDFIDRKHGAKVEYPHPDLEPVLAPTYGVILYQEQVMQIAQVLAGYTLGGADLLRRAMGKKKAEEMAKQREIFTRGAVERQVDEANATYIFDLMEKFAGYGFNKSHSAAYALLSYQTAWLKAHYPAAFMSSVLSADMDNTDKVVTLIDECASMRLRVMPPDVNASDYRFTTLDEGSILYGLGAIKGVGQSALDSIIEERNDHGPYRDLVDFCHRIDSQKVNKRVLEALIRAGAMDQLGPNRATLMARLPSAIHAAEQHHRNALAGQNDLFGGGDNNAAQMVHEVAAIPEWDEDSRLRAEKETLGLYLTGHPIERHLPELGQFCSGRIAAQCELAESVSGRGGGQRYGRAGHATTLAGLVTAFRTKNMQSGKMAFVTLDDRSGRVEVKVAPDDYESHAQSIAIDRILVVKGDLSVDDFSGGYQLRAKEIFDISQAREQYARLLRLRLDRARTGNGMIQHLQDALAPYRDAGRCAIRIAYTTPEGRAELALGEQWRVRPADALLDRLRTIFGERSVEILY